MMNRSATIYELTNEQARCTGGHAGVKGNPLVDNQHNQIAED